LALVNEEEEIVMSVGQEIRKIRLKSKMTQKGLSQSSGLAVSYLSRLENDRMVPSLKTLTKLSNALEVPVASFFDDEAHLETKDDCPVSLSGQCILDQLFVGPGQNPKNGIEAYSQEHLETLRLCNFLLQTGKKEVLITMYTFMKSLLALSETSKAGSPERSFLLKAHGQ
jgi:transcriptional regulator with XRE-family HTH domain